MKKAAKIIGITIVCMLIASAVSIVGIGSAENRGVKSPEEGWLVGYVYKYNETGDPVIANNTQIGVWWVNETAYDTTVTTVTNATTGYYNITLSPGTYSVLIFNETDNLFNSTDPATIAITAGQEKEHNVTLILPDKNKAKSIYAFSNWQNLMMDVTAITRRGVHEMRYLIDSDPFDLWGGNANGIVENSEVEGYKSFVWGIMNTTVVNTTESFTVDGYAYDLNVTTGSLTLTGLEGRITSLAECSMIFVGNFTNTTVDETLPDHTLKLNITYTDPNATQEYTINMSAIEPAGKWRRNVTEATANVTITGWNVIKITTVEVAEGGSEWITVNVTKDIVAPLAVEGLEAVHGNESVALSWNPSTEADLDHYNVYYKNETFTDVNGLTPIEVPKTDTTKTVDGLTNKVTYYFAVTAVDVLLNENKTVTPVSATPNAAPIASALAITPAEPKTTDDLVASYTYYDYDADAESGTEIRWYKYEDDVPVLQEAYNDTTVPSAATAKGQVWYFTVKPKDGIDFGDLVTSATVTILDSAPTLTNPTIEPAEGDVDTEFTFSVTYTDADGDAPTSVRVVIDGINYNMSKVSGEYATGAEYEYKTKLTAGTHTYKFNVDVAGVTVTETASAEITVKEKPIEWLYIVAIIIIIIIIIAIAVAVAKKKKKPEVPPEEKPGE